MEEQKIKEIFAPYDVSGDREILYELDDTDIYNIVERIESITEKENKDTEGVSQKKEKSWENKIFGASEFRMFVANGNHTQPEIMWFGRVFDEFIESLNPQEQKEEDNKGLITDTEGNIWPIICAMCERPSMQVVRPGKVQCSYCG